MTPWPHQERGHQDIMRALDRACKNVLVTSPTGGGKSLMMFRLADWALSCTVYSNRKMLTDQLISGAQKNRLRFGVRAAEYGEFYDSSAPLQITSIQTEHSRVIRSEQMEHNESHIVIVDEAHMQKADSAQQLFNLHLGDGSAIIGFTATPLGVSHIYDELVIAGTNSELRRTGAHLPCLVYAPSEIDTTQIKKEKVGEDFSSGDIKAIWSQAIYGNVIEHHLRLNPELKPALLMAPGVKEAVWFAQEYEKRGIPAAAVDGKEIWFRGQRWKSTRENRSKVNAALVAGEIKVICNRFVYREAVDIPELYHLILATPIGSLLSYVQSVGRVLRNHSSLDHVIVQDHGGNWWRHGSPNEDRDWQKYWKLDPRVPVAERRERFLDGKNSDEGEKEPITCPNCQAVRAKGIVCHNCGKEASRSVRTVIQRDGRLVEKSGDVYRKRRTKSTPEIHHKWKSMYFRMKNADKTFAQAYGFFAYENKGVYPPKDIPFMPVNRLDWHRRIKDVPREELIQ